MRQYNRSRSGLRSSRSRRSGCSPCGESLSQQPMASVIKNPGFELDPPGTSKDQLTGWSYFSESESGAIDDEQVEINDSRAFKGTQSLRIGARSDNRGSCQGGNRNANQLLVANNGEPINSNTEFVTVWIRDQEWSSPSRFDFRQELFFNNGAYPVSNPFQPEEKVRIFKVRWDGQDIDRVAETRTGSDGEEWKRYSVKIPDTIDKNNFSVGFLNHMDTWDCNSGWGGSNIDSIQLTDEEGQFVEAGCSIDIPGVGEMDCLPALALVGAGTVAAGAGVVAINNLLSE